jgi:ring-1,2-phenylacetyl-CoA epoxidase subunit PaaE
MNNYTLKILEIRKETTESVTLCFKQPGLKKVKYFSGQYLSLIIRINGRKYVRPYSFSSAPSVDSFLEVTVKQVPDGIVSNYINTELRVGDVIEVLEPMGDFTYDFTNPKHSAYFWGVGSGITPLFSIIKEVLHKHPNTEVHLVYGNKNLETEIFKNQLSQMQQEYPLTFSINNFYSQLELVESNKEIHKGRITSEFINRLLSKNIYVKESVHYICGPSDLKKNIKNNLIELEVPITSIYSEEFELTIDPKELEDVEDSIVAILFQDELSEINVPKGKSVLDIALDYGIEISYSCQTGNCNTCKAKLKGGQLKMIGLSKERDDLEKDEFLLCCSYPLTQKISVEIIK